MSCATALELQQLARGGFDVRVERHVDGCDACAMALAREAALELALRAVMRERRCGTSPDFAPPAPTREDLRTRRSGLFALGAMLALVLFAALPSRAESADVAGVETCAGVADGGDAVRALPLALGGDLEHGTP